MKTATIFFSAIFFLSIAGAAFLAGPLWMLCLWTAPAALALMISGMAFLGMDFFFGPDIRRIAPVIGVVLGLCAAAYLELSGAVDVMLLSQEKPPLDHVGTKLLFSGSAGVAAAAVCFGMTGLRSPSPGIKTAGILAVTLGFYGAAYVPVVFHFAFPRPWLCALIVFSGAVLSVFLRRGARMPSSNNE